MISYLLWDVYDDEGIKCLKIVYVRLSICIMSYKQVENTNNAQEI